MSHSSFSLQIKSYYIIIIKQRCHKKNDVTQYNLRIIKSYALMLYIFMFINKINAIQKNYFYTLFTLFCYTNGV